MSPKPAGQHTHPDNSPQFTVSRALPRQTDGWFQRAEAALLGAIPCRAGCSHCCIGPFAITILDVQALHEGLARLEQYERDDIRRRASEQTAILENAAPALKQTPFIDQLPDAETDRLVALLQDAPCPALSSEGLCRLYDHRPLTCRSMGIPVEEHSQTFGACAVQTFVPIRRLSSSFREEEDTLAGQEAAALHQLKQSRSTAGEEVLLPYGFLPGFGAIVGRSRL
jgi:Fe-S-cluster containining protein